MKGASKDGMFKVTIGRSATMYGVSIGKEIGVNTWVAFAGANNQTVVDEDLTMLADEMQQVLKACELGASTSWQFISI